MSPEELLDIVRSVSASDRVGIDNAATPLTIIIEPAALHKVCDAVYRHPSLYFDMLSCVTVIDNGPSAGSMDIVYHLYSIPHDLRLALKTQVSRDQAVIDTVSDIWKTALWHEREAFDMFGVTFSGHPDLRRILMPADWVGYPLRKDYQQDQYYRDIKIEY